MIKKTTMVVIFDLKKFSFIDFVLNDRRSLSAKRPRSASGKSSGCRFSLSAERNANAKATKCATFGFPFSILDIGFLPLLGKFEPHICQWYGFFSVLAAIIRESSNKQLVIENREDFAVHSSTWPSSAKGEWRVIGYINIRGKIRYFFHVCCYGFS